MPSSIAALMRALKAVTCAFFASSAMLTTAPQTILQLLCARIFPISSSQAA